MHGDCIFIKNRTFSGAFTCFLITAGLKDILEVGAVGDEAAMKVSECCYLWVVSAPPGAPPYPPDLPTAFYQREITSRVAFFSPKCEKSHA